MTRIVVNVVEINRRRHVELEGIMLAIAEAIAAGEPGERMGQNPREQLAPVRELRRALAELLTRPLPEALMDSTAEVAAELVAPTHALEQLADELDKVLASGRFDSEGDPVGDELEGIIGRVRALAR